MIWLLFFILISLSNQKPISVASQEKKSQIATLATDSEIPGLRSPNRPYFSVADPNLFNRQLFDSNFC